MKRMFKILIILLVILLLPAVLWWFFGRGNPNALWQIVNQQCVPNQQQNKEPAPCLKVDLTDGYVLFKDSKGPYHDLVIPTKKVSGIDTPLLQTENAPPYFALAWNNRRYISAEVGKPLKDAWVSLAVNSKYGRSQNQLHIHIACLRQDVYTVLGEQAQQIDQQWRPLAVKLVGHQYLVRKLSDTDLIKEDPFRLLQSYVVKQGDNIGNYGLALTVSPQGEMLLLANRMKLSDLNLGSAGEIQDYQCNIAGN
jgi:CDP-diacylglycerol pyrophosphatase